MVLQVNCEPVFLTDLELGFVLIISPLTEMPTLLTLPISKPTVLAEQFQALTFFKII